MADDDLTIGEVGRVLRRVEAAILSQGEMLNDIRIQTTRTNGRVDRHDDQLRDLESTVVWAWRLIVGTIITTVVVWMIRK
jgi:hypothetical protein